MREQGGAGETMQRRGAKGMWLSPTSQFLFRLLPGLPMVQAKKNLGVKKSPLSHIYHLDPWTAEVGGGGDTINLNAK